MKNVLLVNALLLILFLRDTSGGRTHDKPIVDATPYPLPAGSRLLQDLGFLAWLLLDSRVVYVPMAYNPTFVMFSSLKPLCFNSLKNESPFSDNARA
ncbi:MAG TPA: hypothetical protein VKJ47_16280 [Candidatus Binatia bacterium]|nr:hypothetical protein [Candidatus Binatia bacterium]